MVYCTLQRMSHVTWRGQWLTDRFNVQDLNFINHIGCYYEVREQFQNFWDVFRFPRLFQTWKMTFSNPVWNGNSRLRCVYMFYLCISDTHVFHVGCQLADIAAELLQLLLEWSQLLLLMLLDVTLRLKSGGDGVCYCCWLLNKQTHTIRDTQPIADWDFPGILQVGGLLTCVKVNFCVWVKWVPLVRTWSEGAEDLKACRSSHKSEVERGPLKALSEEGSAAERSCSSMRFRSRVSFRDWYSCSNNNHRCKESRETNGQINVAVEKRDDLPVGRGETGVPDFSTRCPTPERRSAQQRAAPVSMPPQRHDGKAGQWQGEESLAGSRSILKAHTHINTHFIPNHSMCHHSRSLCCWWSRTHLARFNCYRQVSFKRVAFMTIYVLLVIKSYLIKFLCKRWLIDHHAIYVPLIPVC